MQRIKLPPIQGHYLTLALNSPILTLEIEEESSGNISFLDLNEDSVYEATYGFFETLQDLFQGLKSVANGSYSGITLILSKEELTYIGSYSAVEHSFVLKLREKRVEQVEIIEKQFKVLEAEIQKYRESSQVLQKENEKMAQRVKELEKLIENLKPSVPLKPDVSFNNVSVNCSHFEFSDNNKTVKSIFGTYACLELLPQIPSSGQYSYSLRINHDGKKSICFGITTKTGSTYWNENQNNYRYCIADGKIYGRANQQPIGDGPFGEKDSIIKMIVDMDQGILTFFVDERKVNSCHLLKTDKYFAEISLGHAGDSVTLL